MLSSSHEKCNKHYKNGKNVINLAVKQEIIKYLTYYLELSATIFV